MLAGCVRNKIFTSRKDLTYGTYAGIDTFDTVYYMIIIIEKNNIAVLAHKLNNKMFGTQITHLVKMLYLKINDALEPRLCNIDNPAVIDMLS